MRPGLPGFKGFEVKKCPILIWNDYILKLDLDRPIFTTASAILKGELNMGEAKRRKLLDPNFGTTPKLTSGMGFSNDKKEEFTAWWLGLRSPDTFAEDYPLLTRVQEIQNFLIKSSFVVITAVEVRGSELLVLTFIERNGLVTSALAGYEKLGKVEKSQLDKIVVEINQYYTLELKKANGDCHKFINRLKELPEYQLPPLS